MTILVLGASGALGNAVVAECLRVDNSVMTHSRSGNGTTIAGPIGSKEFLQAIEELMHSTTIHAVFNCVGNYLHGPLGDTAVDSIYECIHTNLIGQILTIQTLLKPMVQAGSGRIANINSLAGRFPSPNESIYTAAKAGFLAFSKSVQLEVLGTGVEIIDFLPGAFKSNMTKHRLDYERLTNASDLASFVVSTTLNKSIFVNEVIVRGVNACSSAN